MSTEIDYAAQKANRTIAREIANHAMELMQDDDFRYTMEHYIRFEFKMVLNSRLKLDRDAEARMQKVKSELIKLGFAI